MEAEERIRKALRRTKSAILHTKALRKEYPDIWPAVGDLEKALERLRALHVKMENGKHLVQLNLFD